MHLRPPKRFGRSDHSSSWQLLPSLLGTEHSDQLPQDGYTVIIVDFFGINIGIIGSREACGGVPGV